jgi:RNA polymerase sigma-70 factor, ECF subfamily
VRSQQDATPDPVSVRFRELVLPELGVLLRVGRRLTGDPADAEDLVQETVLRAYRALDRFDGRHPRAWLLTIQRNAWRNMNRRLRPQLIYDPASLHELPARGADGRTGPEEAVVDDTMDAALVAALTGLPRNFRDTVVLVDVDGLSYREAARVLGVPVGTVMSRLHRARGRLRTQLAQDGVLPGPWRPDAHRQDAHRQDAHRQDAYRQDAHRQGQDGPAPTQRTRTPGLDADHLGSDRP